MHGIHTSILTQHLKKHIRMRTHTHTHTCRGTYHAHTHSTSQHLIYHCTPPYTNTYIMYIYMYTSACKYMQPH